MSLVEVSFITDTACISCNENALVLNYMIVSHFIPVTSTPSITSRLPRAGHNLLRLSIRPRRLPLRQVPATAAAWPTWPSAAAPTCRRYYFHFLIRLKENILFDNLINVLTKHDKAEMVRQNAAGVRIACVRRSSTVQYQICNYQ